MALFLINQLQQMHAAQTALTQELEDVKARYETCKRESRTLQQRLGAAEATLRAYETMRLAG